MRSALSKVARWLRHWPRRKILIWGSASLALLLVAVTGTGYVMLRHFNANLQQDDIRGLLGAQPVNLHPQAENIMVLGSDSRQGLSKAYGSGLVTDQSDTLMIIHIPADRKWAEVMSIPRDSWVNIPACKMGNGQMSAPQQFKINEAFAIGNLDGNHTALGIACTVKTLEQDTGIYINHFIAVNFTGFKDMVAALGGVYECNPTPINDPNSNLHLAAGTHLLTPTQALGYVRARYTLGDGSDLERIGRQQAFMSSLVSRVKSELLNPIAIYRFLDATTRSLTIDSQLGGITGLYNLGAVAARHPVEQDRLLHRSRTSRAARSCPATPRTCCGRSRKTARSSPRSATTCPRAARCSPRPRAGRRPASPRACPRTASAWRARPPPRRARHAATPSTKPTPEHLRLRCRLRSTSTSAARRHSGAHRQPVHLRWLRLARHAPRVRLPLTG